MSKKRAIHMNSVITLLIIGVFSVTSLLLVIIGQEVYSRLAYKNSNNCSIRTSLSYVATKIHQMDEEGIIALEKRQGGDMLVMHQKAGSKEYETCIYFKDGSLYETFGEKGQSQLISKESQKGVVTEVGGVWMEELNNHLLCITAGDKDGKKESVTINIRSRR